MSRKSNPKGNKLNPEASISPLETFLWPEEAAENRSSSMVLGRTQRAIQPKLGPSAVSTDNSATSRVEYTVQWNQGESQTSSSAAHQPENRRKQVQVTENGSRVGVQRNQVEYTVQWNREGYQQLGTSITRPSTIASRGVVPLSQHEIDVESKRRTAMYSQTDGAARLWHLDQDIARKSKEYGYAPEQRLHTARFYPAHSPSYPERAPGTLHIESSQTLNSRSWEVMIDESESRLDALVKAQQGNQYSRRSLWSRVARRRQDDKEIPTNSRSSISSLSYAETEMSSIAEVVRETNYSGGEDEQVNGARSESPMSDGLPKMWKSVSQIWDSSSHISRTNSYDPLSPLQDKTPSIRGLFPEGGEGGFWPNLEASDQGLMVAAIVEEDVDPFVIPAIEFDPDAKPPTKHVQDNRFKVYLMICFAMIFVVAIVLSLGMLWTFETRLPGIPYRETIGIQENIEYWLNRSISDEPTDPYRQALHWIVHEDTKRIQPADSTFQQRFVLALFYYLTSQERDWDVDCAPLYPHIGSDLCRMNFHEFSIEEVGRNLGRHWLSASPECEWGGILCDRLGNVRTIRLEAAGLNSRLPSELTKLPFLKGMLFGRNYLSGNIPEALSAEQKHLTFLELLGNKLSGTLPSIPFRSIVALDIRDNGLNGTATSSFASSLNLKTFVVADNRLSGIFPQHIGDGSSPHAIIAENNLFSGTIPAVFGTSLPGLGTLRLENNLFSGKIPGGLGSQDLLKRISLGSNLLTGTIPKSLLSCSGCHNLGVGKNKLTGTLSSSIGSAKKLVSIDISGNMLNGTIPASMFTLPRLHSVRLEGNNFTGSFPDASCAFQSVAFNSVFSMSADCRASSDGKVEILCPCCTVCCDSNGKNCLDVNYR